MADEEPPPTEPPLLTKEPTEETKEDEQATKDKETKEPFLLDDPSSNFSIAIHTILNTAHQSHGLLHNDYTAYRSYVTRRLSRLRHNPSVSKQLTHGSKSMHKMKNVKRHAYHSRMEALTVQDVNTHVNHVLVFLFQCERAWAQAMELKAQHEELRMEATTAAATATSSTSTTQLLGKKKPSPASVRQHYLKRLKKAVGFVEQLVAMGKQVCDTRTQLEIDCYAGWMKGNWFTEKKDWKNACQSYAVALKHCQTLSSPGAVLAQEEQRTAESLQVSDFFHSRATNTLQPLFRYTLYELEKEKEEGSSSSTEMLLDPLVLELRHAAAAEQVVGVVGQGAVKMENVNSATISFRGCNAPLDDGTIRLSFLKIDTCHSEWTSKPTDDAKFLELLNAYEDASSLISKHVTEYDGMGTGPAIAQKRRECLTLLGYCHFEKLKLLMDRTEGMVEDLRKGDGEIVQGGTTTHKQQGLQQQEDADAKYKRVEEITHLYDALLQNARTVESLPGGMNDGDEEVEDEFVLEAKANVLRIRSLRCYYLGRMYAADVVAKYTEALALYGQAGTLAMEAAEEIAACQDMDRADEWIDAMASLELEITGAKCRAEACAYLAKRGSGASSATTGATLLRRLDDFDSGGRSFRLANVPPALEPIACKPSFFDIAHKYVTDFLGDDLEFHVNAHKLQSRGFLSWFRK